MNEDSRRGIRLCDVLICTDMKTIGWGIIGCGDVTENKSGPAFGKAKNSALVAVMRRNAAKAEDYAKRHNVPRWFDDAHKLIADPEIDAVYIATPPDTHAAYTLACAAAGKPVYVEKPMARDYEECKHMVHACRRAAVKLFVAYYRRALPRFLKVKELVDDGAIGHVRMVNIVYHQPPADEDRDRANLPWRVQPDIAGAGRFLDLASHTLDLLDYVLGPIHQAKGFANNQAHLYPAEDAVAAAFSFDSGVLGTGLWNFVSGDKRDSVEIIGEKGRIEFATFGFANEPVRLMTPAGVEEFVIPHPPHIQQPMIQSVVDDLLGTGTCVSTGETGARTSRVMDMVLADWRMLKLG
jgi:predicted dehydrogenase